MENNLNQNELLKESVELQKQINKNTKITRNFTILICLFVIIGFVIVINSIYKIDIDSLNSSLKNLNTITEQVKEKDIDTESLNELIKNLSEVAEDLSTATNFVENKVDGFNEGVSNIKDSITDFITSDDEVLEEETTEEVDTEEVINESTESSNALNSLENAISDFFCKDNKEEN